MIEKIEPYDLMLILKAYLIEGKSHREIQREILGIPAPSRGGGFEAMKILHHYGIKGKDKSIFKSGIIKGKLSKEVEEILLDYTRTEKQAELYFNSGNSNQAINPNNLPTTRLSLIHSRIYQNKLREFTLENYQNSCALCAINQSDLLVCSHIIPWGIDSEKRLELDNVISFCVLHDRLFENGYFGFDDNLNIVLNHSKCDDYIQTLLRNSVFKLPQFSIPKKEYLQYHLQEICNLEND